MELKKNDRVKYMARIGTVMSELGYYAYVDKLSWIDVLLDGDEHICQIRKDSLKKIEDKTVKEIPICKIEMPKLKIDSNIDINKMAKEMKKGLEEMQNNMEWGHKGNKPIQLNRKEDEKILNKNKLHNLAMYKEIDLPTMLMKLAEESMEVSIAIMNEDKENLIEELLDVMQVCIGIAYTQNIDLNKHIEKHNNKLLSRGHKFL